jgi:hypothetical protein
MTDGERELIRELISQANSVLTEYVDNDQIVTAFLEDVSFEAVNVLYREVHRRHDARRRRKR